MSSEFTIGSPVMAAHLNSILQRIAAIAANCPSVSAVTTVNVAGYGYVGVKGALPGVGAFVPVISQVHGTSGELQIVAPMFLDAAFPADTADQRTYQQVGQMIKLQSIVSGGSESVTIAPDYAGGSDADALRAGPVCYTLAANTTTAPSSAYGGLGVYLATKQTGSFEYEQDEMPLTLWIRPEGIETE